MKSKTKFFILASALAGGMAVAPASAQNTAHGPGDLIMTIQNPGGVTNNTNIYIATLGATSTVFRDAAPGSFTILTNLNSTLQNFGSSWYDLTTIFIGAVNYRGNNEFSTSLLTGDPHRTLYLTQARSTVGTVGVANSSGINLGVGNANQAVSNITSVKDNAENTPAGSFPVVSLTTTTSFVDDQNPVVGGLQQPGYGLIGGGVQANFGSGSFGTFGAAGSIEMALDLYRLQFRNDLPGQYGFNAPTQTGEYLGTLTIAQNGDVGYLKADVVPEPSSIALMALGLVGFAARRRRPAPAHA